MSNVDHPDVHAPYVQELYEKGDWPALVRYWLAHELHDPAMELAIRIVEELSPSEDWRCLLAFLQEARVDPLNPERELDQDVLEQLEPEEHNTGILVLLFPRAILCDLAVELPPQQQAQLFQIGIEAAQQCTEAAEIQSDVPLQACLCGLVSRAHQHQNDLERAQEHLQQAVGFYRGLSTERPDVYRGYLAAMVYNLSLLLSDLNELDLARKHLHEALHIRRLLAETDPDLYLPEVATTLNNLGNLLRDLNDLKQAREHLQEALHIRRQLAETDPGVYLPFLARSLNNLGNLLRDLNELELAQEHLQEALKLYRELSAVRPAVYWPELAKVLNNLGTLLRVLNNLDLAREHLLEALHIRRRLAARSPNDYRLDLAGSLNDLGNLVGDLNDPDLAREHLQEALKLYRELEAGRPDVFQPFVAAALNNLGSLLCRLNDHQAALHHFREALHIRRELARQRPDVYRPLVAGSLNNLGNLMNNLNALELARAHYKEASQLYEVIASQFPTASLTERQASWTNLGRVCLKSNDSVDRDLSVAREALSQARGCAEALRQCFHNPDQRKRVQGESLHCYELLVRACVDIWRISADFEALSEAVEVAEASRSRNLMDMLSVEALQPAQAPPELTEKFRELRDRLMRAERRLHFEEESAYRTSTIQPEAESTENRKRQVRLSFDSQATSLPVPELPSTDPLERLREQVAQLRGEHGTLLSTIQQKHDPEFDPDRPIPPVDLVTMQQLIPTDVSTVVVQFMLTPDRAYVFVLTTDKVEVVELSDLNDGQVWNIAVDWYNAYYESRGQQNRDFDEKLPQLLEPITQRIVQPLVDKLHGRGIQRWIVAPNKALHVFPLHACRLEDGRYLTDVVEVVYVPSLSILERCRKRERPQPSEVLLLQDPTEDLLFTRIEGAGLQQLYPKANTLTGPISNKEQILQLAPQCNVLHYSGHAFFDPMDPLRSALILGSKEANQSEKWLTLRDIFCELHLRSNVLTVISGCESGMIRPGKVDEFIGLALGFLYAGSASVLSTLWAVYDISTALLIERFYQEWSQGRKIGAALREAQRWLRNGIRSGVQLRDEILPIQLERLKEEALHEACRESVDRFAQRFPSSPPFASPVHWAPFVASGLTW